MACSITMTGIAAECKDSIGGIKAAYIAEHADLTSLTETSNVITAITMATGKTFKPFVFRKETGNFTSTINSDDAAGTTFVQSEIVLQFTKQETAKRLEIAALMVGNCAVIIEDGNGKYWFFGEDFPVVLTAGSAASGTAMGDFNGYNITLTDKSKALPKEVDADIIAGLLPA
jgi:hypothetical protein